MVKLLKINNGDDTSGRLIANFDNLEINKNSQIALLNTSIKVYEKYIDVNPNNDELEFYLYAGGNRTLVRLIQGQYNLESFRAMLQRVLNSALAYVNASVVVADQNLLIKNGFQWKVTLANNDNLVISYNRVERYFKPVEGALNTLTVADTLTDIPNSINPVIQYKIYTNNDVDGWNHSIQSDRFFTDGCGVLQFRTLEPTTQFACGLIQQRKLDNVVEPEDLVYGFYMNQDLPDGGNVYIRYKSNVDGNIYIIDTTFKARYNYIFLCQLSLGKLSFYVVAPAVGGGIPLFLWNIDWEYNDIHYIPALSIYTSRAPGDINGNITDFVAYSDPYNIISDLRNDYIEIPKSGLELINNVEIIERTQVTLNFMGNELLYGFYNGILRANEVASTWISNSKISLNNLPNNLKIMLKNMQLSSYDSYSRDREDILMSLPTINYENNRVSFNMAYPVFIDINNAEPMNLNQLIIELKDFKNEYIEVEKDDFDLTLLIRDRSEFL